MQFDPSAASILQGFASRKLIAVSYPAPALPAVALVLTSLNALLPEGKKLILPGYLPPAEPLNAFSLRGAFEVARQQREAVLSLLRTEHENGTPPAAFLIQGLKAQALTLTLLADVARLLADENGGPKMPPLGFDDVAPYLYRYTANVAAGFGMEQALTSYAGKALAMQPAASSLAEQLTRSFVKLEDADLAPLGSNLEEYPEEEYWLALRWGLPRYFAAPLAPAPAAPPAVLMPGGDEGRETRAALGWDQVG